MNPSTSTANANTDLASDGAHDRTRTDDLLLTMQMLYQLSYVGSMLSILCLKSRSRPPADLERETGFEPATLSLEG